MCQILDCLDIHENFLPARFGVFQQNWSQADAKGLGVWSRYPDERSCVYGERVLTLLESNLLQSAGNGFDGLHALSELRYGVAVLRQLAVRDEANIEIAYSAKGRTLQLFPDVSLAGVGGDKE